MVTSSTILSPCVVVYYIGGGGQNRIADIVYIAMCACTSDRCYPSGSFKEGGGGWGRRRRMKKTQAIGWIVVLYSPFLAGDSNPYGETFIHSRAVISCCCCCVYIALYLCRVKQKEEEEKKERIWGLEAICYWLRLESSQKHGRYVWVKKS